METVFTKIHCAPGGKFTSEEVVLDFPEPSKPTEPEPTDSEILDILLGVSE